VSAAAELLRPDVAVMDMPVKSGIAATRDLLARQSTVRVIMLSGSSIARSIEDAANAGAVGYLFKTGDPTLLFHAVRTVAAGGTAWPAQPPWPACDLPDAG
jgi:DNA-binding NarL/FixJ family response regulator